MARSFRWLYARLPYGLVVLSMIAPLVGVTFGREAGLIAFYLVTCAAACFWSDLVKIPVVWRIAGCLLSVVAMMPVSVDQPWGIAAKACALASCCALVGVHQRRAARG